PPLGFPASTELDRKLILVKYFFQSCRATSRTLSAKISSFDSGKSAFDHVNENLLGVSADRKSPSHTESTKRIGDNRRPPWRMSLITPSAARLKPYGSLLPVGFSSIAQKPISMSTLSASATAIDTGSVGTRSAGPSGL